MTPIIYPYKMGSKSAKLLAQVLGCKRVYPDRKYEPKDNHVVINWGNSTIPHWLYAYNKQLEYWHNLDNWLNTPQTIKHASNKLLTFEKLQAYNVSIPEFTTSAEEVYEDLSTSYQVEWLARTALTGHSGKGIVPIMGGTEYGAEGRAFPNAPLYVKYIKKHKEYRVHIFNGKIIDVQQKKKKQEVPNEEVNYQIRSHDNGWVFCRNIEDPDPEVLTQAVRAVNALGLDFGAVDVIFNDHEQKAYVLEVNTAPGLEGSTVDIYANAIKEHL